MLLIWIKDNRYVLQDYLQLKSSKDWYWDDDARAFYPTDSGGALKKLTVAPEWDQPKDPYLTRVEDVSKKLYLNQP